MKSLIPPLVVRCHAVLLLTLMACNKSRSSQLTTIRANLIGTYGLRAETGKPAGGVVFNELDSLYPCQRDDLVTFNADSTYDYVDSGLSCSPSNSYIGT